MLVNNVFCEIELCKNTAHCRIEGTALCGSCMDAMAAMNSDNEAYFRAQLAVARPITECRWVCEACDSEWDSFHIRNGICLDCRSMLALLWTV